MQKKIILKTTTNKFVEINPCGATIALSTGKISGMKPVPVRTTVNDITRCLRNGIKVNELPEGVRSVEKIALMSNTANKVFSDKHLEFLKTINVGYIDEAEEVFAGNKLCHSTLTPADKIPNNTNDKSVSDINDYAKVIEFITDETVTNKLQIVMQYETIVMRAVASRTTDAETINNIVSAFNAVTVEDGTLASRITRFVEAAKRSIIHDYYNGTVEENKPTETVAEPEPEPETDAPTIEEPAVEEPSVEENAVEGETVEPETENVEEETTAEEAASEEVKPNNNGNGNKKNKKNRNK